MVKKRFGPKSTMKGLPKGSKAKVNFLSLPKEVGTDFETGYGMNNNSKWEMDIELLDHPTQDSGLMVWQTTAQVIRIEIFGLVEKCEGVKPLLGQLEKDLCGSTWEIISDDNGVINIQEL